MKRHIERILILFALFCRADTGPSRLFPRHLMKSVLAIAAVALALYFCGYTACAALTLVAAITLGVIQRRQRQQRIQHRLSVLTAAITDSAPHAGFRDGSTFLLPDGRTLGYKSYGASTADCKRTVIYLHGTPGSRHEVFPDETLLTERGIRLIAVDRTGFGRSSFDASRTRESQAQDIADFVSSLDLAPRSLSLMGFSGGGAYCLACVNHPELAREIVSATIIAGEGPFVEYPPELHAALRRDSPLLWLSGPLLLRVGPIGRAVMRLWFRREMESVVLDAHEFVKGKYGKRFLPPKQTSAATKGATKHSAEETAWTESEPGRLYAMILRNAHSVWVEPSLSGGCGVESGLRDMIVAKTAWRFRLEDVGSSTHFAFWHGIKDNLRSHAVSSYMHDRMRSAKSSRVHLLPNQGHALFLRKDNWIKMIDEIMSFE